MKRVLQFFVFLFLFLTLGFVAYFVYQHTQKEKRLPVFSAVPKSSIAIIETSNLTKAWQQLSENEMWKKAAQTKQLGEFQETIEMVEGYAKKGGIADMILEDRPMLVSVHPVSGSELGFLFLVDLQSAQGIKWLEGLLKVTDLEIEEESHQVDGKSIGITILKNIGEGMNIYLSFFENLLVVSTERRIIEESLDAITIAPWLSDMKFSTLKSEMDTGKLFNFYFNYKMLSNFTGVFMNETDSSLLQVEKELLYSALDLDIRKEEFEMNGTTLLDSIPSYFRALTNVKPGQMNSDEILTDQAAAVVSISFESFDQFLEEVKNQFSKENEKDATDYQETIDLVEGLLEIDIEKDFFSWIGNEIALAKLRPGQDARAEDVLVAIHTNSIEQAEAGMLRIMEQIKKRSPLKFKTFHHRNYDIHYLEMKGFFRMFLGKMFGKLERPYIAFVDDYVLLSNSLKTLKNNISHYLNGRTLSSSGPFLDFKAKMREEANINMFVQMPKAYSGMFHYSSAETQKDLKANKDVIMSFALVGLQMYPAKDGLKTKLLTAYDSLAIANDELELLELKADDEMFNVSVERLEFAVFLPDTVELQTEDYVLMHEDSTSKRFEVKVLEGKFSGEGRYYYPSGNLMSEVNYVKGQLMGNAIFYYDKFGKKPKAKAVYEENKVTGQYVGYYDNGAIRNKIKYKKGLAHGEAEFFYKNGALRMSGDYRKGKKDGKWLLYDEKGKKQGSEKWSRGIRKR